MDFVAIDFETANSGRDSVCALGLVVVQGGLIIEKRYWLIRPHKLYFHPFNIMIHGITANDVINEPEFIDLWPSIKPYLENKYIVAHNASFDMSVLRYVLDSYNIPYPIFDYGCTLIASKKVWPGLPSYRLDYIADHLEVEFEHHHALSDAFAAAAIAIAACREKVANSMHQLFEVINCRSGCLFDGGYKPASGAKNHKYCSLKS